IVNNRGVLGVAWVSDAMNGVSGACGVWTPFGVIHLERLVRCCGIPALRCLTPKVSDTASDSSLTPPLTRLWPHLDPASDSPRPRLAASQHGVAARAVL